MFSEPTIQRLSDTNYQVSFGGDSGTFAEFYTEAVLDQAQSEIQGRQVYKNVDMIKMMFAGNNTTVRIRPVQLKQEGNVPADPDRFPKQWAAFKNSQEQVQDGMPIEQWPPISKALAMELKAMKIHTVEALASVTDANLTWMGARQMRDNAKAWLAEAESGAETIRLRNQVEQLQEQIKALMNQNAGFSTSQKQQQVVTSTQAAPIPEALEIKPFVSKMRGRPKKVTDGENISSVDAASGE